jgi:hypothetical protein
VTTANTSISPSANNISKQGTANWGVPKNTTFILVSSHVGGSGESSKGVLQYHESTNERGAVTRDRMACPQIVSQIGGTFVQTAPYLRLRESCRILRK